MQKVKEKLNLVTYSLSLLFRRSPWLSTLFIILIAPAGVIAYHECDGKHPARKYHQ